LPGGPCGGGGERREASSVPCATASGALAERAAPAARGSRARGVGDTTRTARGACARWGGSERPGHGGVRITARDVASSAPNLPSFALRQLSVERRPAPGAVSIVARRDELRCESEPSECEAVLDRSELPPLASGSSERRTRSNS